MSRIDDLVPASEAVIWRWPGARRDIMVWASLIGFVALGLGALAFMAWKVGSGFGFFVDKALRPDFVITTVIVCVLGAGVGYLLTAPYRRYGRILVTDRRVAARGGSFRKRSRVIRRDRIDSATLYEGDRTVVLHGPDGELFRDRHFPDAAEFLEVLRVPVGVWPARKRGAGVAAVRGIGLAFALLGFASASAATVLIVEPADPDVPFAENAPGIVAYFALWLGLTLADIVVAIFATTALARITLKPESYGVFVHSINPLWLGMDPRARAPLYRVLGFLRGSVRFCARLLGGIPGEPPAPEPGHREPRIPMAAR